MLKRCIVEFSTKSHEITIFVKLMKGVKLLCNLLCHKLQKF